MGILVLANQYNQSRLLNLCELYTTKQVDRMCCDRIEKSEIDVIGLLLCAEVRSIYFMQRNKTIILQSVTYESTDKRYQVLEWFQAKGYIWKTCMKADVLWKN